MRRSGTDTKAAILAAARERFAAEGYERTTIRAVAGDVAIDPSMVMRYFGNKEGLFAAAADFDLRLPNLSGIPAERVGRALVTHFLERWEDDEGLLVLLRTGLTNAGGAARLRAIFATQLVPLVPARHGAQADVRAGLVATQMLGLALCRYVAKLPPVVGMSRAEIVDWVGPTVQRYLAADDPAADRPHAA
jgi:AcrR family transcriptional regulator